MKIHEPVLVNEVLKGLNIKKKAHLNKGKLVIDATVGTAGHAKEIVKTGTFVLGIDADSEMIKISQERLNKACPDKNKEVLVNCFKLTKGNFRNIDVIAKKGGFKKVDGVLFDLGVSNLHLKSKSRGFSFGAEDAKLDMRLNPESQKVTASDLLNLLRRDQLLDLFSDVMSKGQAKKLSWLIYDHRKISPFVTVEDFLSVCKRIKTARNLHYATKPFLALRIAVNGELDNIKEALPKALSLLKSQGRLLVISFHSSEDVLVKNFFLDSKNLNTGTILTKKPITPSLREIQSNPKSRSAKLRILKKI